MRLERRSAVSLPATHWQCGVQAQCQGCACTRLQDRSALRLKNSQIPHRSSKHVEYASQHVLNHSLNTYKAPGMMTAATQLLMPSSCWQKTHYTTATKQHSSSGISATTRCNHASMCRMLVPLKLQHHTSATVYS